MVFAVLVIPLALAALKGGHEGIKMIRTGRTIKKNPHALIEAYLSEDEWNKFNDSEDPEEMRRILGWAIQKRRHDQMTWVPIRQAILDVVNNHNINEEQRMRLVFQAVRHHYQLQEAA